MPTRQFSFVLAITLLTGSTISSLGQWQRTLVQGDAETTYDVPVPHPLAWWTHNPLKLDESGDLLLGRTANGGHLLTAQDYRVRQKVTTLGTIQGHRIVQVLTTIHAGPRAITFGGPDVNDPPTQWKSLLVGVNANRYVEIYALQSNLFQIGSAGVYGLGPNAFLGTYDPDTGNGGGCSDAYWWFDKAGAHPLDITKLQEAIRRATPKNGIYGTQCWALHAGAANLEIEVLPRNEVRCHACGGLGVVNASYRIQKGVAIPGSVKFNAQSER